MWLEITEAERQEVHELWDRLAEAGVGAAGERIADVMQTLARLVGAQSGYWMGTIRLEGVSDPVNGWRPRSIWYLNPSKKREEIRKEHVKRLEKGAVFPSIIKNLEKAGTFRINTLQQLVPPGYFETEFYKSLVAPLGIADTIYVSTPLSDNVESWFVFERTDPEQAKFATRECDLLEYAVRPMQWYHRRLALYEGLTLVDEHFTRSEKKVLPSLLSDKTEREIGEELGLSKSTIHTYLMSICRKYGVRGRAGLMALWLGEMPEK